MLEVLPLGGPEGVARGPLHKSHKNQSGSFLDVNIYVCTCACVHSCLNLGYCSALPSDLVLTSIRVNWGALKKDCGSSIAEGSIHHIAVSCDPTDVSHTAKDITWLVVKHELQTQERTLKSLSSRSHSFPTHTKTQTCAQQ